MTAVGALELVGHIAQGQTVLVTAAAGGTGHIALQWAKKYGVRVAGTCGSEEKEQMLKDSDRPLDNVSISAVTVTLMQPR